MERVGTGNAGGPRSIEATGVVLCFPIMRNPKSMSEVLQSKNGSRMSTSNGGMRSRDKDDEDDDDEDDEVDEDEDQSKRRLFISRE